MARSKNRRALDSANRASNALTAFEHLLGPVYEAEIPGDYVCARDLASARQISECRAGQILRGLFAEGKVDRKAFKPDGRKVWFYRVR